MSHEAPDIIPIIFSYQSSESVNSRCGSMAKELKQNATVVVPLPHRTFKSGPSVVVRIMVRPGLVLMIYGCSRTINRLQACQRWSLTATTTALCFLDDDNDFENCPSVYDYFPFDETLSHNATTCATRFESDASQREAVGHHIEKQHWGDD